MTHSLIYALDFDGVICDSAIETALSGWKAAHTLWPDMAPDAPAEQVERFRQVRPIIETGYEAILTMRLLHLGRTLTEIYSQHKTDFRMLMQEVSIDNATLKALFGETRDRWIDDDQAEWIAKNPLYPGIAEKLRRLGEHQTWYVITTKQERFVQEILRANDIELAEEHLFGLDRRLSKVAVLKHLLPRHPEQRLCFVEDRLPTLIDVSADEALDSVALRFALWGYNTDDDKQQAKERGLQLPNADQLSGLINP